MDISQEAIELQILCEEVTGIISHSLEGPTFTPTLFKLLSE
jgi:hypothetical protein